jgi:hypothetical protein
MPGCQDKRVRRGTTGGRTRPREFAIRAHRWMMVPTVRPSSPLTTLRASPGRRRVFHEQAGLSPSGVRVTLPQFLSGTQDSSLSEYPAWSECRGSHPDDNAWKARRLLNHTRKQSRSRGSNSPRWALQVPSVPRTGRRSHWRMLPPLAVDTNDRAVLTDNGVVEMEGVAPSKAACKAAPHPHAHPRGPMENRTPISTLPR